MVRKRYFPIRLWYVVATVFAVFTYFFGLDSLHIPKNGDEYPYTHITRMTAQSGSLLPLQSTLNGMRNTKPPLLFWQGIAATNWGEQWDLVNLRVPSVIYTLLTSCLVFLLAYRLSGRGGTAFLAVLSYLAFFSTYRYGRPFLTNSPEVFWLFLPFFTLIYWRTSVAQSTLKMPVIFGLMVGIGLLYKSFALALPVAVALTWCYLSLRQYELRTFLVRDSLKVTITILISLAIFSLWFVFDPDPSAIWQEFVVKENIGKFEKSQSYVLQMLWGKSSIWALIVSYPVNAMFLAIPIVALAVVSFKRRESLSSEQRMLWIWVLSLLIVFMLPSQRSGRYLLAGMPALAILLALNWDRIHVNVFRFALLSIAVPIVGMAYLSVGFQDLLQDDSIYTLVHWLLLSGLVAAVIFCLCFKPLIKPVLNTIIIASYLTFSVFLMPLDGPRGQYSAQARQYADGKEVWVPYNFNAKFERYRFLLPGADIQGYRTRGKKLPDPEALIERYGRVVIARPPGDTPCKKCRIIGERLDLRTRLTASEIKRIVFARDLRPLLVKEYLVEG